MPAPEPASAAELRREAVSLRSHGAFDLAAIHEEWANQAERGEGIKLFHGDWDDEEWPDAR